MDEPIHLATLRRSLALLEEAIPEISDGRDKQIISEHATLMRLNIRRLEEWAKEHKPISANSLACMEGE
jgi:hypothetical protein